MEGFFFLVFVYAYTCLCCVCVLDLCDGWTRANNTHTHTHRIQEPHSFFKSNSRLGRVPSIGSTGINIYIYMFVYGLCVVFAILCYHCTIEYYYYILCTCRYYYSTSCGIYLCAYVCVRVYLYFMNLNF